MPKMTRDYTDVMLIRISPDVHEAVRKLCLRFPKRSVSEFVRQAIHTQLKLEGRVMAEQGGVCDISKP